MNRSLRLLHRAPALLALAAALLAGPGGVGAQATGSQDWQPTALSGATVRVFATLDGALVAQTGDGQLQRSDDGGQTFRPIPLPPGAASGSPGPVEVDSSDANRLFVAGVGGLDRTMNGGVSYDRVLTDGVAGLSLSPVVPSLLYVAVPLSSSSLRLLRSEDGGATLQVLETLTSQNPLCIFGLSVLQADAGDGQRVFRAASCTAGRDLASPQFSRALERSLDRGATWQVVARPAGGFANQLVGGSSSESARYYLADLQPFFARPAALHRSDDGGATFAEVFRLPPGQAAPAPDGAGPHPAIGALAYDPRQPNRVFLGRRNRVGGVLASQDAGLTFAALGRQDIGEVFDLALAPGGQVLFAATSQGLFRLSLQPGPPTPPPPASTPAPVQLPAPAGRG